MKKVRVSEKILKNSLKPLLKHKEWIESVYVYGSAVSKKSANDIDVLVIINDSKGSPGQRVLGGIEKLCALIEQSGTKKGLNFHFQPLKLLSKWWHLLLDGEPWIVTSLKNVIAVYDKRGLVGEASVLVKDELLFKKEERAKRLIEKSSRYSVQNRQLLLGSLATLSSVATEAAQILLLFDNKVILNKRKIVEELEKNYVLIGEEIIGNYKEIIDLEEKMEKGSLSEFSAENMEYYLEKTKKFVSKVESMLSKE